MPGSFDADPPVIVSPNEYHFAVIAKPTGTVVYRSKVYGTLSHSEIASQLRHIADRLEANE